MSVIKGCLKEDSKELKKLVMMYWEVVKKYDAEGKLLPEMILVRVLFCFRASVFCVRLLFLFWTLFTPRTGQMIDFPT